MTVEPFFTFVMQQQPLLLWSQSHKALGSIPADPLLSSLSISIVLSYAFRKPFELCCTQNILHIVVTVNIWEQQGCSFSLLWFVFCCLAFLKKIATCLCEIKIYLLLNYFMILYMFLLFQIYLCYEVLSICCEICCSLN